jgi:RNA polymerase-interacting CarD/CdnL/TRCF family regulator
MQYKAGDVIVHPIYGVGNILNIEEKRFSEIGACLYYKIALIRSNIWVPIEAQEEVGLRLVTAREDLDQYREVIMSPPDLADINLSGKDVEQSLANRLKEGSFQTICNIVRDLTVLNWQKPLGVSARNILRKAQEKLYTEWAMAAGISVDEATEEITSLLKATHQEAALK